MSTKDLRNTSEEKVKRLYKIVKQVQSNLWKLMIVGSLSIGFIGVVEYAIIRDIRHTEQATVDPEAVSILLDTDRAAILLLHYDRELCRIESDIRRIGTDIYLYYWEAIRSSGKFTAKQLSDEITKYQYLLNNSSVDTICNAVSNMDNGDEKIDLNGINMLQNQAIDLDSEFDTAMSEYLSAYHDYNDMLEKHEKVLEAFNYTSIFTEVELIEEEN